MLRALADHLLDRRGGRATVDGDRPQQRHRPAEERQPEQFTLEHPGQWRQILLQKNGFPGRLVLGHHDHRPIGNVLDAAEPVIDATGDAQPLDIETAPVLGDAIALGEGQRKSQHHQRRYDTGREQQAQ